MNDKGKIIFGLAVLFIVVISPVLYTLAVGGGGPRPELELPEGESNCIEAKQYMTAYHMDLLNEWRDAVVRDGKETYTSKDYDKTYDMSLTKTCMSCHTKRETFCNRCHDYANVQPYCWDCHVEPEEVGDGRE